MRVGNRAAVPSYNAPVRQPIGRIEEILLGESPAIRRVRELVQKVAPTRLSVLVHGPTGAGKELVAQALHLLSGRSGPFVAFNVCAIAESLFEDALFGHVRGGFTGATDSSPGFLLEAQAGTIFLDEIGGLPLAAQTKLLRALETRQFRPVGAAADRSSDFRVVTATNENVGHLTAAGRFRRDLLHRLDGAVIEVPGLNERRKDIPLLAHHFALIARSGRTSAANGQSAPPITESAIELLVHHPWPGNVRELRTVIERAGALADEDCIDAGAVKSALRMRVPGASKAIVGICPARYERMLEVLNVHGWDVDATAAALGVHRATVYRTMRRIAETFGVSPSNSLRTNRRRDNAETRQAE